MNTGRTSHSTGADEPLLFSPPLSRKGLITALSGTWKGLHMYDKAALAGIRSIGNVWIDHLARPFFWIKWANIYIAFNAILALLGLATFIIFVFVATGPPPGNQVRFGVNVIWFIETFIKLLLVLLPGWVALKNINVINSITQNYTIISLLMVSFFCFENSMIFLLFWPRGFDFSTLQFGLVAWSAAWAVEWLRSQAVEPWGVKLLDVLSTPSQTPRALHSFET